MQNDIHCLTDGSRGKLVRGGWGDAIHTACMMSALTGETSINGCMAKGWPKWLAELGTVIFDNAPEGEILSRSFAFAKAVKAAEDRGADFDRVFRDIRLTAILPIAMESVGSGNEWWRVECRNVVQWCIDNDGQKAPGINADWTTKTAGVALAVSAANADRAAGAAWASGASGIYWASLAAGAAWASGTSGIYWASLADGDSWASDWAADISSQKWFSADTRIFAATIGALHGNNTKREGA